MSGVQVADALTRLANVVDRAGIDGCAVKIEHVKDDDTLIPGDLIPTITLSLERAGGKGLRCGSTYPLQPQPLHGRHRNRPG
jgi:hypothetical protein